MNNFKQTIWVKNEESLISLLNELWKQWGGEITFHAEQDSTGFVVIFETK